MAGIAEYSDILVAGYKRSKSEANGLVMRFGSQFRVILQCSKEATAIVDYGDAQEISNTIVLCGDPCSRVAESSRFPMIQGVVQQFRDHVVQWLLDHAISDQRRILSTSAWKSSLGMKAAISRLSTFAICSACCPLATLYARKSD